MHSGPEFALVIPTLNEAGNIAVVLDRVHAALSPLEIPYEVLVIDDDSQDGTADLVRRYAEHDPRTRVLVRRGQRGLAGAVLYGWQNTSAEFLGVIDADLQHPPETLPALLRGAREGYDVVIASRYANGHSVSNWNKARLLISRCSTLATLPLQKKKGVQVKDPLSGFFIVRRGCIAGLDLQPYGFKILLEILVKGHIQNTLEIPFEFSVRHSGRSKADFRVALHYFTLLGKLSRYALFRPGQQ